MSLLFQITCPKKDWCAGVFSTALRAGNSRKEGRKGEKMDM